MADAKTQGKKAFWEKVESLQAKADANQAKIDAVEKAKANEPDHKGRNVAAMFAAKQAPHGTSGKLGERPYSLQRAVGVFKGWLPDDEAKEERQISAKLHSLYRARGMHTEAGAKSMLIPWATDWIPTDSSEGESVRQECREKMRMDRAGYDPDEFRSQLRAKGFSGKALGTLIDTAGGTMVPGPVLGELIDLQRNLEVFARAGATEVGMAPNGSMLYPKLTGGATAAWYGEAQTGTESQATTGDLLLQAKKLMVFTRVNNELFMFSSLGAEAIFRGDMARVAAIKADQAMLEGTGGTQIAGLISGAYTIASSWTTGTDAVIRSRATTTDNTNGDTMAPQDFRKLESTLPDEVENTAWVMRKNMFGILTTRRADAVSAADGAGPFVVNMYEQDFQGRQVESINGKPVIKSSQISNTRLSQDGTSGKSLTYVLTGMFSDWLIARMGVAELTPNIYGSNAYENDQTLLRLIQRLDAGPRHLASFAFMDYLKQS